MRTLIVALLFSSLLADAGAAEIVSITPAAGAPGQSVNVVGGPFSAATEILFGNQTVRPETVENDALKFTVPPVPEGEYALRLRNGREEEAPAFTFLVSPPTPRLRALAPPTLDACSLLQGERVALSGEFPPHSQVLLDGAVIPADHVEQNEITFLVPPLKTGIHQIVVAGPGDRRSIPHALVVNGVPRIDAVNQGADQVTSYEVVISGENFLYTSVLVANGTPLSQAVEGDVAENYTALNRPGGEDYVRYVDCRSIVYVRHPTTRVPKTVTLQVVNPGGEQSAVHVVVIP